MAEGRRDGTNVAIRGCPITRSLADTTCPARSTSWVAAVPSSPMLAGGVR
ncbi:hypothetical protein [Nonomuraea sp. KM90]